MLIPTLSFSDDQKIYDQAYNRFLQNDYKGAIELFLKIPDNIDAQYYLYAIYYEQKEFEKSHYWLELCSNNGDAYCQNDLGHFYDNGIFVSKNKQKAYDLFFKAAEQGSSNAYTTIASYYLDGDVVNQSYSKAFEYYNLGVEAEFGNTERALYGLALMYEKGLGTKADFQKAKQLYLEAHDLGHEVSLNRINALEGDAFYALDIAEKYKTGSDISIGLPIDYEDSAFFYKIAEFKGSGDIVGFQELLDQIDEGGFFRELKRAAERFEIWKSNLGFQDPNDTLYEITEYFLNHTGTASYINSNFLITNLHITHSDENMSIKCDKLVGYEPYSNKYEEYEIYDTLYLPNTLDVDLIFNPKGTEFNKISINTDNPKLGETIISIGFPQGNNLSKYPKITSGLVSSDFGFQNNPDEFIIDATSYGGSSGSPIFNSFNQLTGILYGGPIQVLGDSEDSEVINDPNLAFVIKSNYLKKFLDANNIPYLQDDKSTKQEVSEVVDKNISRLRQIECYKKAT